MGKQKNRSGKRKPAISRFNYPDKYRYLKGLMDDHDDFVLNEIQTGHIQQWELPLIPVGAENECKSRFFKLLPGLLSEVQKGVDKNPTAARYGKKQLPNEKGDCAEKLFAADITEMEYRMYSTYPSWSAVLHMPLAGAMWLVRKINENGKTTELMDLLAPFHDDEAYGKCFNEYASMYFFDNESDTTLYIDVLIAFLRRNCTEIQAETPDNWLTVNIENLLVASDSASTDESDGKGTYRKLYDDILELAGAENCKEAKDSIVADIHKYVVTYCKAIAEYCVTKKPEEIRAAARFSASMDDWDAMMGFLNLHFYNGDDDVWDLVTDPDAALAAAAYTDTCYSDLTLKVAGRVPVGDPYKTFFGYLQLLDSVDDHLCLFGSLTAILCTAAAQIPWMLESFLNVNRPRAKETGKEIGYKPYTEIIDAKEANAPEYIPLDLSKRYTLPYKNQTTFTEGYDSGHNTARYTAAHILYHLTGCAIEVTAPTAGLLKEREVLIAAGVAPEEADRLIDLAMMLRKFDVSVCESEVYESVCKKSGQNDVVPITGSRMNEDCEEQIAVLRSQIEELHRENVRLEEENAEDKKRLRALRKENYDLAHSLTPKAKVDNEESDASDVLLSDELFVIEKAVPEENMPENIQWPYTADSRIVIVGGHDSWRRTLKQMFTNVKFVDKESNTIDQYLIRNADVVLIQSNAICHPLFYATRDACVRSKVPYRYIKTAGWKSSALEIVGIDRELCAAGTETEKGA